jgi:hypothetical protein
MLPLSSRALLSGGAKFELDMEKAELSLGADDADDALEQDFYFKEYLKNPKFLNEAILNSVGDDENFGDFGELLEKMSDVTPDGKVKKLVSPVHWPLVSCKYKLTSLTLYRTYVILHPYYLYRSFVRGAGALFPEMEKSGTTTLLMQRIRRIPLTRVSSEESLTRSDSVLASALRGSSSQFPR